MATIYVVDDEPRFADMLVQAVESWGHTAKYFQDGRDVLNLIIQRQTPLPDIILTDFMMGDIDGLTFRSYMNESPETRSIPMIMITGSIKTVRSRIKPLGLDTILEKPVELSALQQAIDRILSTKK